MIKHLLNRTVAVSRKQRVSDGQGGWPEVYVPHSELKLRVQSVSLSEKMEASQSGADISCVAYSEPDVDLKIGDQLSGKEISEFYPPLYVVGSLPPSEKHHNKWLLTARAPEGS